MSSAIRGESCCRPFLRDHPLIRVFSFSMKRLAECWDPRVKLVLAGKLRLCSHSPSTANRSLKILWACGRSGALGNGKWVDRSVSFGTDSVTIGHDLNAVAEA